MTSALFGHRKGAFTGAIADTVGKVEEAEGGTLFLDEVGDLTSDAQARLLRFLNDRSYERLGEPKERRADVRIIAATNRRLEEEVKAGSFREDLFFRLNVISLTVPPLRERDGDARAACARTTSCFFGARQGRPELSFSAEAEKAIQSYALARKSPGTCERRRAGRDPRPRRRHRARGSRDHAHGIDRRTARTALRPATIGGDVTIEEIEREHIARVIARAQTLEAAARILGIDATTLQRKRKRYGLA